MKKKSPKKTATKKKGKKSRGRGKDQLKADVAAIAQILSVVALDGNDDDERNAEIREGWRDRLIEIHQRWAAMESTV